MEENFRQVVDGKKGFICDMDGVIYHGNRLLPGAKEFVQWLNENGKNYLFLTNSSERSPKELQQKLRRMGDVLLPRNHQKISKHTQFHSILPFRHISDTIVPCATSLNKRIRRSDQPGDSCICRRPDVQGTLARRQAIHGPS